MSDSPAGSLRVCRAGRPPRPAIPRLTLLRSGRAGPGKPPGTTGVPRAPAAAAEAAGVNGTCLLFMIVDMTAITAAPPGDVPRDANAPGKSRAAIGSRHL